MGLMKTFGDHNNSAIVAKNHDKFLEHLEDSTDTVFICARYLHDKGETVTIKPMTKAETYGEWETHADTGDLEVQVDGIPQRIEVKGISTDFVDASDWKFPDFIVCAAHSWDKADPKPLAYFIFNRKRTHVAIVYGKDSSTWTKAGKYDRRYTEYAQEFYFSPLDKVVWRKTHLKESGEAPIKAPAEEAGAPSIDDAREAVEDARRLRDQWASACLSLAQAQDWESVEYKKGHSVIGGAYGWRLFCAQANLTILRDQTYPILISRRDTQEP